jgi:hypothetical protein
MRTSACVRALLLPALLLPGIGGPRGDSIELTSGETLRGIDLEKKGEGYVFTLENGDVVYLKADLIGRVTRTQGREKVEFRGDEVTLRQKVRALRRERLAEKRQALRRIEAWASGGRGAAAARDAMLALPERDRETHFDAALRGSGRPAARRLAAERLSEYATERAMGALVDAAVRDRHPGVRDASLRSLEIQALSLAASAGAAPAPSTASGLSTTPPSVSGGRDAVTARISRQLTPYLKSASRSERTRAADALAVFPSRQAMPELIRTLRLSWSGFGRAAVFQGTQRAYIGDYELVSGGTGFSIVEVADPVVRTTQTGTVLDVDVVRAELVARLRAMKRISGRDFGADVARWQRWWNEEGE